MKNFKIFLSILLVLTFVFFSVSCMENGDGETVKIERKKNDKNDLEETSDKDISSEDVSIDDFFPSENTGNDGSHSATPEKPVDGYGVDRSRLDPFPSPLFDHETGKYGYVDYDGNTVIEPKFNFASNFYCGAADIEIDEQYAYIAPDGRFLTQLMPYEQETGYESDWWSYFYDEEKELYGFSNDADEIVLEAQFYDVWDFWEGVAPATLDGENWGFINESGKWVIEAKYEYADPFSYSLAAVKVDGSYGYINKSGDFVITPQFEYAGSFQYGLALVTIDGKDGYINTNGTLVTDLYTSEEKNPHESDDWYFNYDEDAGLYGFLNYDDEYVIEPSFEDVWDFNNGLAPATLDGENWGFINEAGEWVIEPVFDYAYSFDDNGLASVTYNDGDACVNLEGEIFTF